MAGPRAKINLAGAVAGEILPTAGGRLRGGAGGRTEDRIVALLRAAVEAIEDERFTRKALALKARQALAGRMDWRRVLEDVAGLDALLDGPHRALYALARFEETAVGQLALPLTDTRAVA